MGGWLEPSDFISKNIDLELRVWQRFYQRVRDFLPRYPTTLQDDLDMLERDKKENNLTVNERNIIILRATEKQLL